MRAALVAVVLAGCSSPAAPPTQNAPIAQTRSTGNEAADSDGDGIMDMRDQCPRVPEDRDGDEDGDGCPESGPTDRDGDGILDASDMCPDDPEDRDGYQDEDGCPDRDNDADGILDMNDMCPNEPETLNGQLDTDGCPP